MPIARALYTAVPPRAKNGAMGDFLKTSTFLLVYNNIN